MKRPHITMAMGALAGLAGAGALLAPPAALAQPSVPRILALDMVAKGDDDNRLRWPVALAEGPAGELAVADAHGGGRVFLFAAEPLQWRLTQVIDLPATPLSMAFQGSRYVLSTRGEPALVALETATHRLRPLPVAQGVVPGALATLPDGSVLLQDLAEGKVLVLAPAGGMTLRATLERPAVALAASAGGGFYAAFPAQAEIRRYDAGGDLLESFTLPPDGPVPAWPAGLAVTAAGEILASDRHAGRLLVLDASGRLQGQGSRKGWAPGLLLFPGAMTLLADGRLAVVDEGNGRIQTFRRTDTPTEP